MKHSVLSSRRALLRAVGISAATGIAGCTGRPGPNSYGLLVVNYRDSWREIHVTVTRTDTAETVLDETYSLGSGDRVTGDSVFRGPNTYTITAETATGTSASTDFTVEEDGQPPVDAFHVQLTEDGEFALVLPAP